MIPVIALLTFGRLEYSLITIDSIKNNLVSPHAWYVADGGSTKEEHAKVLSALSDQEVIGDHSIWQSAGDNWNLALQNIHAVSDYVIWMENDWTLTHPLDLTPFVTLLEREESIGMVRLGGIAVGLECETVGFYGIHYLKLKRSTQYAYSGNPSLRHKRFVKSYGYYSTQLDPGHTELDFDGRLRQKEGCEILFPVESGWGWFGHVGTERSY